MGMHRDQARRAAGRAKIAAVGLAAVGGVVLFAPFPKLDAAPVGPTAGPVAPDPTTPDPKAPAAFNAETASAILSEHGPEPRPIAAGTDPTHPDDPPIGAEPHNDGTTTEPPPVEVAAGGPELRYLGPIVGPRRTLAMVALDGQQRIVAVGEEVDGKVVKEVAPTQILLDDSSGVEHVVPKAEQLLDWSMDAPTQRGLASKRLPGGASKAGLNGSEHADHLDIETGMDGDIKRAEAARRMAEERSGDRTNEDHANTPSGNAGVPRPARPLPPGSAIPKTPVGARGATPATTPKYPPARPPIPTNKPKIDEKKAGNQA